MSILNRNSEPTLSEATGDLPPARMYHLGPSEGPSKTILRIDSSARVKGSHGRALADRLLELKAAREPLRVIERDLALGIPLLSEEFVGANFTPEEQRSHAQRQLLEPSDRLIDELESADELVIALPIYNFHAPASFKAWIDLVARARKTFRYTDKGPVGLLKDRPVHVIVTSGGTALGSEGDFLSGWLRQVLGFLGLRDVRIVAADQLMSDTEARLAEVEGQLIHLVGSSVAA